MKRRRYSTSHAQRRANRRYKRKHREKYARSSRKANCKRFILRDATSAELDQVSKYLKQARKKISEQ